MKFAICAALAAITWTVFGQTLGHEFVNYDDNTYVYQNARVIGGLTPSGVAWAFTHFDNDNWHPLTSISHMLDCQLFGLKAGGHHFTNVLLHTIAVVLLFLVLNRMTSGPSSPRQPNRTGTIWRSAFVAAVFAIHPLHVESVAWIAERKDVLSAVFFMLTLGAYVRYAHGPTLARYIAMSILFALGLMSKPMFVTVPLILLLLDYWPLNRSQPPARQSGYGGGARSEVRDLKPEAGSKRQSWINLIAEKIPLLVLSGALSIATVLAQGKTAVARLEELPFAWRITNALSAYIVYIWQMFWPAKLALVYPHPGRLPLWETAGASALLIAITICAFVLRKRYPYLITGWCWYLVMLVPVIGLIQVGGQAHADRYTYLPQIGLYVAATWSIADLSISWRHRREILTAAALIVLAAFGWRAWIQTSYWHDSEKLLRQTLTLTTKNDVAHLGLGEFLLERQRVDEAILEFRTVLTRHPNDADTKFKLASALLQKGEWEAAISEYERALKIDPTNSEAETALANVLLEHGRIDEAIQHYRNILRLQPSSALAHYNLAVGLHRQGHLSEAILHYKEAIAIQPGYPDADYFLGQALLQNGQPDEAKIHLEKR
ncbi:MAG TPA: tetratricopeptide repeat protein [Chthoniobacterales bacterium]|nr:tetratricopeptide repeat protein [Chthoniobacterales bacterium]